MLEFAAAIASLSNYGFRLQVSVGCCTVDVLRHLSSEEMARSLPGVSSDRMTRIASHIIAQRR